MGNIWKSFHMSFIPSMRRFLGMPFGYGVYVHWPYCTELCSYCNFNKYRQPSYIDHSKLLDSYVTELQHLLQLADYPTVTSVYFGGGTPSLAPPTTVEAILDCIRSSVGLSSHKVEVSLEINPRLDVIEKLNQFEEIGVNRLSVGIQSLNDDRLITMRRDHTASHALEVLNRACSLMPAGKTNVDLMFGLPGQELDEWVDHLTQISIHPIGHVSLYQLTLESSTPLAKAVRRREISLPPKSIVTDMYFSASEILERQGLCQYEVSNYATNGCMSNHNLNYWLGGNYIGIGPGAHSRYQSPQSSNWICSINALTPQQWINAVSKEGHSMKAIKEITPMERFEEILVTSMRTRYGLSQTHCESFDLDFHQLLKSFQLHCPALFTTNLLHSTDSSLTATAKGLAVMDTLITDLYIAMY